MENKLVTVVVPIYNVEKYLNECIESIVGQTYKNLEILLIDDGSTDSCPRICDEWAEKDARIRVIHKQNQGLGMARNTGIDNASGRYICFYDSDDYVDVHTIEKAYEKARKYRADIVVYGIRSFCDSDNSVETYIPTTAKNIFEGSEIQTELLPDLIDSTHEKSKSANLPFSACTCLFSMELIVSSKWSFVSEREIISEDSFSLLKLYKDVNKVYVMNEALYWYRKNELSLSKSYRPDRYEKTRWFYLRAKELAIENGYSAEVQARIAGLFYNFTIDCMKQILASKNTYNNKMKNIHQIVFDEVLGSCLKRCRYGMKNLAKIVLKRAILTKSTFIVAILVYLKVRYK